MSGDVFLAICVALSLIILAAAAALTILRIAIGPTAADRLLGLYMMMLATAGLVGVAGVRTGVAAHVDLLFVLIVMALLSLVAGARRVGPASDARAHERKADGS